MAAPKGTKPPGGSRAGKPNKNTKALKDMILGALSDAGGQAYLLTQAKTNPTAFMTLIGKVLPTEVVAQVFHADVSDEPIDHEKAKQAWTDQISGHA